MNMTKSLENRLSSFAEQCIEKNNKTTVYVTLSSYEFMAVQHVATVLKIKKRDVINFAVTDLVSAAVKAGTWVDKKTWMALPDDGERSAPEKKIGMSELDEYEDDYDDEEDEEDV
jgi:hypothetical protein